MKLSNNLKKFFSSFFWTLAILLFYICFFNMFFFELTGFNFLKELGILLGFRK